MNETTNLTTLTETPEEPDEGRARANANASAEEETPKPPPDPRYSVREPNVGHAVTLAGILAAGAENPQVFDAIDAKQNSAAMVFLFAGALRNADARNGLLSLLADLWTREVEDHEVEKPLDDWIYEVTPQQKKQGAPDREERWRMISRKNRKLMLKQFEVQELPFGALMEFGRHLAALDSISDFLGSVQTLVPEGSGSSSTESSDATPSGPSGG